MGKINVSTDAVDVSIVMGNSANPKSITMAFRMAVSIRRSANSLPEENQKSFVEKMCNHYGCDVSTVSTFIELLNMGGKHEYENLVKDFIHEFRD